MTNPADDGSEPLSIEQSVPIQRFANLSAQLEALQAEVLRCSTARERAALDAFDAGVSARDLAKAARVSPAAVYKVVRSARAKADEA